MLTESSVFKSLFHDSYHVAITPLLGAVIPKKAFVLPGQGSSYPGMFAAQITRTPHFREIFRQADQLAGFFDLLPISSYVLNPLSLPQEKMHIYRNCALFCSEVAAVHYLIEKKVIPSFLTGHSFGECASLVGSGLFDFEAMFSVVVHRNLACPPANELGSMIALTGTEEKIQSVLSMGGVFLANRNSHKQLVIAVAKDVKDDVVRNLRKLRIPHIPLHQLPQPYHSPLMEPYRIKIAERLKALRLRPASPAYDLYSGVSHNWITAENYLATDYVELLSRQITEPVDFVDQVLKLQARGATSFYEVGPGRMLETAIKAIACGFEGSSGSIPYRSLETAFDVFDKEKFQTVIKNEKLAESKWFKKIQAVVQSVTGYKDSEIQIDQSFQKDLGIDSIKKAEILFKIISQENIGSSSDFSITRFGTIYQAVEYLEAYSDQVDPLRSEHHGEIEILRPTWLPAPAWRHHLLDKQISEHGVAEVRFASGLLSQIIAASKRLRACGKKPVILLRVDESSKSGDELIANFHACYQPAVKDETLPPFGVVLLDTTHDGRYAGWASFLKSIKKEWPAFNFQYLRSRPGDVPTTNEILRDHVYSQRRDLQYLEGKRYISDHQVYPLQSLERKAPCHIVAVGGTSGINFEILNRFPFIAGDRLLLLGRRAADHPEIQSALNSLRNRWPNFEYVSVDAQEFESLRQTVFTEENRHGRIDFIINACGYETSQKFADREPDSLQPEIRSKLLPFQNIKRVVESIPVGRVLHFSSFVSQFGNVGQAVYAYNNGRIEADCDGVHHAVAWGAWENVGMTTNEGILQKIKEAGISLIPIDVGAEIAARILFTPVALPSVLCVFDKKDSFPLNADQQHNLQTALIGERQNAFEAVFYKDVDVKKDFFLNDHLILGRQVVPASYFLAQMCHLARAQFSRPVSLTNVSVQNVLILESGTAAIKVQAFYREPHELKIFSVLPHCAANFAPAKTLSPKMASPFWATQNIDMAEMYQRMFEFGETFRVIQKAFVDEDKSMHVELDLEAFPQLTGDCLFDFHLTLFEVAFQSMTVLAGLLCEKFTMPNHIGSIDVNPDVRVGRTIGLRPKLKSLEDLFMTADIEIMNDENEVFMLMSDVKVSLHQPNKLTTTRFMRAL